MALPYDKLVCVCVLCLFLFSTFLTSLWCVGWPHKHICTQNHIHIHTISRVHTFLLGATWPRTSKNTNQNPIQTIKCSYFYMVRVGWLHQVNGVAVDDIYVYIYIYMCVYKTNSCTRVCLALFLLLYGASGLPAHKVNGIAVGGHRVVDTRWSAVHQLLN